MVITSQRISLWKALQESVIKVQYRTAEGNWGVFDKPYVSVEEVENSFCITGYLSPHDIAVSNPIAGIYDVLEFEVFNDEIQN